jgi:hypothetical protein
MANSGTVTAGSAALASQYNNLRLDVLDVSTGHTHAGTTNEGAKVAATGVSSGTAALNAVLTADGSGGAAFLALSAAGADFQEFTSSGSWVKPAGKSAVYVLALGGGGGGGANQTFSGTTHSAQGGAGGGHATFWFDASDLAGTVTVTIGAGGTGEVSDAATSDNTEGNGGGTGGNTSFGTALIAFGGAGAGQSSINNQTYTVGGSNGKPVSYGRSKQSQTDSTLDTTRMNVNFTQASAGLNIRAGVGGNSSSGTGYAGLDTMFGAAGGGAGGGATTGSTFPGGAGGRGFGMQLGAAASGGSASANGANAGTAGIGNGGGGGGSRITAGTAGSGGDGYLGGGGGGGGAACNQGNTLSVRGGNGGAGGGGYMLVISV